MSAEVLKQLRPEQSLEALADEYVHTESMLASDPRTAAWAEGAQALLARIDNTQRAQRDLWRAETRANAQVGYRDASTDQLVWSVVRRLRYVYGGAGHSEFDYFFPKEPPNRVIRKGLESELDDLKHWPDALANAKDADLQQFAPLVSQALTDGQAVLAAREAALQATKRHRFDHIEPLVADLNKHRTDLFADLLKVAAAHGHGQEWVRLFFK